MHAVACCLETSLPVDSHLPDWTMGYSGPVESSIPEKLGFKEHTKQLDEEGFEKNNVHCEAVYLFKKKKLKIGVLPTTLCNSFTFI